ncbi:MAG: hypothetical protein K1060chlam3_00833 [Candidatus Anoxychlamydiales bacterium]|nr:hypothetical protein [Candidatus Anoxychlamydiales bacterium]
MILSKIWERKIFINTFKLILFFLFAIFLIVIVIDFSVHGAKIFAHPKTSISLILQYYFNLFFIQLNLFLALTFLLAIIKVLSDMNIHHELTALRMAAISAKKISRPFFIIALFISIISFVNFQYFYPKSLSFKDTFKEKYLKKTQYTKKMQPNVIYLEDGAKLVYQKYDQLQNKLFDAYFIKNSSDIWHAKYLSFNANEAIGKYVDHLTRKDKNFEKIESYQSYTFKDIALNENTNMFDPFENRSITNLFKLNSSKNICQKEKNEILSYLNYKLAMPFVSLIIVLAIFPPLITFSKNISIFFISTFALFGFIIFHTIMDSALILAENTAKSPYIILWLPIILISFIFGRRFQKI